LRSSATPKSGGAIFRDSTIAPWDRRLPPVLAIEALAFDAEAAHAAAVRSIFRTISPLFSSESFFAAKPRYFYDPSKTLFCVLRRAFLGCGPRFTRSPR
jgi:hypothetical protein